jgi:xylose isomerase
MNWKFSAHASFFGAWRDRFNQYQPHRTIQEKFALMGQLQDVDGVELKYPYELEDVALVKRLLAQYELQVAAINVDTKDISRFLHGALSASSAEARQFAVQRLCEGMDIAAELGAEIVTTCPLSDGYDYPFQVDYATAWGHFIDSVRAVAAHREDVKLVLEYQPHEPYAKILLNNVGKMLYVCAEVGAPNVGANLDIGHSFAARESPAEAAALLAGKNRLFYIHTNDNPGEGGDWDMISGAVHLWEWLELLYTLEQVGYDGWLGADIAPKRLNPVDAYQTNVRMVQRMTTLLDRIDPAKIKAWREGDGTIPEVYAYMSALLVG